MTQESALHTKENEQQARKPLTHYSWLSLLRAYGVVLVLGYHFFPWLMPGGFIGVDVFFVFSGYLITSLLISEFRKQGKVDLLAFYQRRFRRLFPALLAMLLVILPLTLTIPEDFRADLARQVAAALSWTTNFYEISTGGSYANALLPHLFVHTWTLSIEMQYYLVWGLLLTILLPLCITTTRGGRRSITRSRKVAAALALVLALASFIAMQIMLLGTEDPSAVYYSTISHAYPILIGSAIGALAGFGRSKLVAVFEQLPPLLAIGLVVLSLGGILAMALLLPFDNRLVYHTGLLLTSLFVALVILVGRGAQEALQKRPEPRVLQYVADRSYSIYLFHWPLLIIFLEWARMLFGRVEIGPDPIYIVTALIALVATFAVSHLCYKYVERPFSSRRVSTPVPSSDRASRRAAALERIPSASVASAASASVGTSPIAPDGHVAKSVGNPLFKKSRVALAALAVVLVSASVCALVFSPAKTAIESDYQVGLLEIDLHQMANSHVALVHTGQGGSMGGEPRLLVKPGTISVIGDSVTILPADTITSLTGAVVDAEVSRAMVNGVGIIEGMQASGTLGEYVVVALATNAHADSFESAVAICEGLAPGHKLVFVTAYGNGSMEELSAQLRTLPSTYPFVTIADWNVAISGRDDLLASDGYHLNGQEAIDIYTNVVVGALEEARNKPAS